MVGVDGAAVSPDTLPVTAFCAGVVAHHWRLSARAPLILGVGLLGATCITAGIVTALLRLVDGLPAGFHLGSSAIPGLTTINSATIGVARAAGVAAILAVETRASAAVATR